MWLKRLKNNKGKKGFTILEVTIVTVIVGVLATLAVPRYQKAIEKSKSAEGVEILGNLLRAQKIYALENGGSYATDLDDLDVDFDVIRYFETPDVYNPADPSTSPLADIRRNKGCGSDLSIFENGSFSCSGSSCSDWGF